MAVAPTKVLVVDDSKLIVKLIIKALLANEIEGYLFKEEHIYTAFDGLEAFELLGKVPDISLIISDVNMPMLNGDELLEILIDTGKKASIEVVMVTTQSTADTLQVQTKKNILGIIEKPFTTESFTQKFNALKKAQSIKESEQKLIHDEHKKQKLLLLDVALNYLKSESLLIEEALLQKELDELFDFDQSIIEEEMIAILLSLLSRYMELKSITKAINETQLKACYYKSIMPEKNEKVIHPLQLHEHFETALKETKAMLKQDPETDANEIFATLFSKLQKPIIDQYTDIKHIRKKSFQLYGPYFVDMIEHFGAIDPRIDNNDMQHLLSVYEEIVEMHAWLKNFYQSAELYKRLPELKSDKRIFAQSNERLKKIFQYLSALILHYTGFIDDKIWELVKASPALIAHIKSIMPEHYPNTANYLLTIGKISNAQHKKYLQEEHENVIILSSFLKTVEMIKSRYEALVPSWSLFGFTQTDLLSAWLHSNKAHKMIIDYDFTTPKHKNGVEYLLALAKQEAAVKALLSAHALYILVPHAKVSELNGYKNMLDFSLITKPLNDKELHRSLFYS